MPSNLGEHVALKTCECGKTFLDNEEAAEHARDCDAMPHIGGSDA